MNIGQNSNLKLTIEYLKLKDVSNLIYFLGEPWCLGALVVSFFCHQDTKAPSKHKVNFIRKIKTAFSFQLILIALIILLTFSSKGIKAQYELNQYLITAAQNNPGIKSKFSAYMAGMEKVPQVGGLPDLNFAFGYFIQPVETRVGPQRAKLSIAQTFPWFGLLSSREDAATSQAESLYEAFEESKSKLYYDVKSAYFDLYFVEKSIDISLENIAILNTLLELTLIKIESGSTSIVDEYRVEMDLNDIENQLALLRDTKYEYTIRFNRLLNVTDDSNVIIPDSLWQEPLLMGKDALIDSIEINNHEVKQIDLRIKAWEENAYAADKAYSPNILIGFDYTFVDKYDNPSLPDNINGKDAMFARIGITIPLYGKKYNGLIRESKLQAEKEGFAKDDKLNRLNIVFEGAYKNYSDAIRRLTLFQRQYQLANRSLDMLMEKYATDGRNFVEVLRIQRKMLEYDLQLDKSRSDINAAVAFIDYLSGK